MLWQRCFNSNLSWFWKKILWNLIIRWYKSSLECGYLLIKLREFFSIFRLIFGFRAHSTLLLSSSTFSVVLSSACSFYSCWFLGLEVKFPEFWLLTGHLSNLWHWANWNPLFSWFSLWFEVSGANNRDHYNKFNFPFRWALLCWF